MACDDVVFCAASFGKRHGLMIKVGAKDMIEGDFSMTSRAWMPNLFIAGAPKSGTSSIHQWIADHPDAVGPYEKETYFFVDEGTHMYSPDNHVKNGIDTFRKNFPSFAGGKKIIVESTPGYIYYDTAISTIPDLESFPKCLFVVREPASQIYSTFQYFKSNWNWIPHDKSFRDFIREVKAGTASYRGNELAENALNHAKYVDYLLKWRDRLGSERIMVRTFDDLMIDNKEFTQGVAEWCGLSSEFYESYDFPRQNETYHPKSIFLQNINIRVRKYLPKGSVYDRARDFYRKLNTNKTKNRSQEDEAALLDLREYFSQSNERLAREFQLDITNWG